MEILEILKYVLPSAVVLAATYLINKQFLEREREKDRLQLITENSKTVTPIRLAAYERLTLFLERINPQNLVVRVTQPGMNALELQRDLLTTIRAEYEHNLSQQIYVSANAWKAVTDIKELITQIVNQAAQTVEIDAKSSELGKKIVEIYSNQENEPVTAAVEVLKSEITLIF
ncbi:MAG: hypothetical protein K5685_04425 [Bacteroidales bacterium]|jgi:hypothetical protein|nr:hypothetical protein [Bacteroidales bacterium]